MIEDFKNIDVDAAIEEFKEILNNIKADSPEDVIEAYVCPECGEALLYYERILATKYRKVDSRDGTLSGGYTDEDAEPTATGIVCSNCKASANSWGDNDFGDEYKAKKILDTVFEGGN